MLLEHAILSIVSRKLTIKFNKFIRNKMPKNFLISSGGLKVGQRPDLTQLTRRHWFPRFPRETFRDQA